MLWLLAAEVVPQRGDGGSQLSGVAQRPLVRPIAESQGLRWGRKSWVKLLASSPVGLSHLIRVH